MKKKKAPRKVASVDRAALVAMLERAIEEMERAIDEYKPPSPQILSEPFPDTMTIKEAKAAREAQMAEFYNPGPDLTSIKTGIREVDDALPYLQHLAVWPESIEPFPGHPQRWEWGARRMFLYAMLYLLTESAGSLDLSERRREPTEEAARQIMAAAKLLDEADNSELATLLLSIAAHAKDARYGTIIPRNLYRGYIAPPELVEAWTESQFTPGKSAQAPPNWREILGRPLTARKGMLLNADIATDAASAMFTSKRGGKARDSNIVKAIARYFPNTQAFLRDQNGYAVIAQLATLCGLTGKTARDNPNEYVRGVLKRGHT